MEMSEKQLFRRVTILNKATGELRVIEGGDIGHCDSPIAPLLDSIRRSVASIMPERHHDLQTLLADGIHIDIDGARQDFYIAAHVKEKKVILGLAALERIWAYIYFYLALDNLSDKHGKGKYIDLTTISAFQPARQLAKWALRCEENKCQSPWPNDLPRPDIESGVDAIVDLTRPYFLLAVCFLLLHEIGHIQCQHTTTALLHSESYNCEFQADAWAAEFMLGKWQDAKRGEAEFSRRYTGIVLGLAVLASVELHHHAAVDDHPTIAERLLKLFERRGPQEVGEQSAIRDFPLHFGGVIIQAHLMNANIPFDFTTEYQDITEYLIAAHRAMAKHKNG